jgi:hypothetical protein
VELNSCLASKQLEYVFEFDANLLNDLLALARVCTGFVSGEFLSGTADREPVFVEQASNLSNDQNILALIVASITTPLNRLELWKLLLPIPENVGFHSTEIAHFTDCEVSLSWDRR